MTKPNKFAKSPSTAAAAHPAKSVAHATKKEKHEKFRSAKSLREHPSFQKFAHILKNVRTPIADLVRARTDQKALSACLPGDVSLYNALRDSARGLLGKDQYKTHLVWSFSVASAAGGANAYASVLDPNLSAEAVSFQALFDEMKMFEAHADWAYSSTIVPTGGQDAVIFYDPVSSAAPVSVVSGMVATQKKGPYGLQPISGGNGAVPQAMDPTGHFKFTATMPSGPQGTDFAASSNVTGQWVDVLATSPNWGYIKIYANGGAGATTTLHGYITVAMHYRCRQ